MPKTIRPHPTMRKLDSTDLSILTHLFADGSISNKQLAENVGLAPSSCLERVRRLQQDKVLTGFSTELNLKALGVHLQAMVALRLKSHTRESIDRFRDEVIAHPETLSLYHTGGQNDFLVHIAVRDTEHLRDFVLRAFTAHDEVASIETTIIFEHKRSPVMPYLGE